VVSFKVLSIAQRTTRNHEMTHKLHLVIESSKTLDLFQQWELYDEKERSIMKDRKKRTNRKEEAKRKILIGYLCFRVFYFLLKISFSFITRVG